MGKKISIVLPIKKFEALLEKIEKLKSCIKESVL
jgi:hypothetical protein